MIGVEKGQGEVRCRVRGTVGITHQRKRKRKWRENGENKRQRKELRKVRKTEGKLKKIRKKKHLQNVGKCESTRRHIADACNLNIEQ
jgi:hypothetical protein